MIPLLVQTLKAELSEDCLNHILTRENSFKLMEKWKKFCSIPALPENIGTKNTDLLQNPGFTIVGVVLRMIGTEAMDMVRIINLVAS